MSRAPEARIWADEIVVDSFAGGGGASLGISWALGRGPDIAINHDAEAIALHKANHPETYHYNEDVWKVDPVEAVAGRPVGLMWASPDCTHHSKARGGKPVKKKIRGLAWSVVRWAAAVRPRVIVLENVEEFQEWGPVLRETNRPCPQRKGQTFRAFVGKLRKLGYEVQWRELRASSYYVPTIRKRLFLIARCDGQPIVWPKPDEQITYLWEGRRIAADVIEWSVPCPSIFTRKKPLAENTLKRIARGLKKFVLESPRPFIVNMANGGNVEDIARPMTTIMTERGGCRAIVTPYIAGVGGRQGQSPERPMGKPFQTITSKADSVVVAPFLKPRYGERDGQAPRVRSLEQPAPVIVPGGNGGDLVSAFLAKHYTTDADSASLFQPTPTVTSIDHNGLCAATLVNLRGTSDSHLHGDDLREPLRTVSASGNHAAEVRAFLVAYYGNEKDGGDLFDPMRTVTSKDRYGLVTIGGTEYQIADIGMRMLQPRELYRAQGFPDSYKIDIEFKGKPLNKTAQVRMVGNSVCPPMARALVAANYIPARKSEAAA